MPGTLKTTLEEAARDVEVLAESVMSAVVPPGGGVDNGELAVRMVGCMAVIAVAGFFMARSWLARVKNGKKVGVPFLLGTGILLGLAAIYCTAGGYHSGGLIVNLRDVGPMVGGLFFGPVTGVVAAVIGAAHRFWVGSATYMDVGDSTIPCVVATMVSGILGSLVWRFNGKRPPRLFVAVFMALLMSAIHMGIVFLYDAEMAADFFGRFWYVWLLCNGLGMGAYVYIAHALRKDAGLGPEFGA